MTVFYAAEITTHTLYIDRTWPWLYGASRIATSAQLRLFQTLLIT
jgi:hypothetical protein